VSAQAIDIPMDHCKSVTAQERNRFTRLFHLINGRMMETNKLRLSFVAPRTAQKHTMEIVAIQSRPGECGWVNGWKRWPYKMSMFESSRPRGPAYSFLVSSAWEHHNGDALDIAESSLDRAKCELFLVGPLVYTLRPISRRGINPHILSSRWF
jgi:hypothetical protein